MADVTGKFQQNAARRAGGAVAAFEGVAFVGRLVPLKGVDMLIEAFGEAHPHQALGTLHREWCVLANVINDRHGTGLLLFV